MKTFLFLKLKVLVLLLYKFSQSQGKGAYWGWVPWPHLDFKLLFVAIISPGFLLLMLGDLREWGFWPGASLSWSLLKPYCGYNEYLCPWLLLEIEQGFQKVLRFKEKMVYFYLMSTWVFVTSKMLAFLMGSLPDPRTPGTCSQSGLRPAGSATNIS